MKWALLFFCLFLVAAVVADEPKVTKGPEDVEILSDGFQYDSESKVAIWHGHVRANDPKLAITCEQLTGVMDDQGGGMKLRRILAETNVVIRITESNNVTVAQSAKAIYTAEDQLLVLSGGDPMLDSQPSNLQLWSPLITVNLQNKALKSVAPTRTQMPPGSMGKLGESGFKPKTGAPAPGPNDCTEVFADDFEFSSESNVAIWRGHVRAKDPKMNLTSDLLTAKLASDDTKAENKNRSLESIVAESNVVIEVTETNGVTTAQGDKAVYSAATETLVLTGAKPMVDLGARQIQLWSPQITMDSRKNSATATKPVVTRLPPGALKNIGGNNLNVEQKGTPPEQTQERAEIFSDDFEFVSESNTAFWRQNVRVKDPKLDLTCGQLTAKLADEGGGLNNIEAASNVVMTITETNGVTTAHGDKAVYLSGSELLVLTGKDAMIQSSASKFTLWSSFITYELMARRLYAKPPYHGAIQQEAVAKANVDNSKAPPRRRTNSEPGK